MRRCGLNMLTIGITISWVLFSRCAKEEFGNPLTYTGSWTVESFVSESFDKGKLISRLENSGSKVVMDEDPEKGSFNNISIDSAFGNQFGPSKYLLEQTVWSRTFKNLGVAGWWLPEDDEKRMLFWGIKSPDSYAKAFNVEMLNSNKMKWTYIESNDSINFSSMSLKQVVILTK